MENSVNNKVTQNPLAHPNCQLHFAVQQLKQQKLQSRQLLEQSQARHQALSANYSQSSTSHISMPTGSDTRKTSNATSSIQKAASLHKVMPSQSTPSQLVPKPPANHRQAVVRKAAAQRISKVTSAERQLNGFQNSLHSAASCEPGTNSAASAHREGRTLSHQVRNPGCCFKYGAKEKAAVTSYNHSPVTPRKERRGGPGERTTH